VLLEARSRCDGRDAWRWSFVDQSRPPSRSLHELHSLNHGTTLADEAVTDWPDDILNLIGGSRCDYEIQR